MKRTIYTTNRTFRSNQNLDAGIAQLASKTNRNDSDLIREAVFKFVTYYQNRPNELLRAY